MLDEYFIKKYEINEWHNCYHDVKYFINNYFNVMHPIKSSVLMNLHQYQEDILDLYSNNQYVIGLLSRQIGISTLTSGYILWKALFNQNQSIAIISDRTRAASDILERITYAYDLLPEFLKLKSFKSSNKTSLEFSHYSRIMAFGAGSSGMKGRSLNMAYFDNFAYGNKNDMEDAYASVIPTLVPSSGQLIIGSTPNTSKDLFAKLWKDTQMGNTYFTPFKVTWDAHPERDAADMERLKQQLGPAAFAREYECQFVDKI